GEGILRVCRELPVVRQTIGQRDAGAGIAPGAESAVQRRTEAGDHSPQPPPARFQASWRLRNLGSRFSSHRVDENQAHGSGRRNRQNHGPCVCAGSTVKEEFLAIVNPAAGGGRSRKLLGPALERLRACGLAVESIETTRPSEAIDITRDAYVKGYRNFI